MITKANIIRVLDTSALIHDPRTLLNFEDDIHITFTVLEELDNLKDRHDKGVSQEARHCINLLERIMKGHSDTALREGVPIHPEAPEAPGRLIMGIDTELTLPDKLKAGIGSQADNSIINYALHVKDKSDKPVMLISRDINMRIKARALGLEAEDVIDSNIPNSRSSDADYMYTGVGYIEGDLFSKAKESDDVTFEDNVYKVPRSWFPDDVQKNYYWYDDKHIGLIIKVEGEHAYTKMIHNGKNKVYGIEPRNVRQQIALSQLMDPNYDLNIMLGGAGSGKTLLAIASALSLVQDKKLYKRVILFRSKDLMDDDPGHLPGTLEEKTVPLLGGFTSSINYLLDRGAGKNGDDDAKPMTGWEYLLERGVIEIGSVSHALGMSYPDAILIFDEFQNFSHAQAKGMISRTGENSKVIILGNLNQVWGKLISARNSGLKKAVDVYQDYDHASVVMFDEVVRSRLAAFTEDNF